MVSFTGYGNMQTTLSIARAAVARERRAGNYPAVQVLHSLVADLLNIRARYEDEADRLRVYRALMRKGART